MPRLVHLKKPLSTDQRKEILYLWAEGKTLSEISAEMKERHGLDLQRQTIHNYTKSPRWEDERRKAIERVESEIHRIPISRRSVRLRIIQSAIVRCSRKGNERSLSSFLDLARKELSEMGPRTQDDRGPQIQNIYQILTDSSDETIKAILTAAAATEVEPEGSRCIEAGIEAGADPEMPESDS